VRDVVTLVAFNLIIIAVTFVLKLGEDLLFSQARQALDDNEGRLLDWLEGFAHDKDWWQTGERP